MRRARSVVAALVLVGFALGSRATPTTAHSLLTSSDPAANAAVATAPTAVTLTFTEPPSPKLSPIQVLDASGTSVTSGPAVAIAPGSPTLRVPLKPLPDGVYTVAWRTVSSVDGHATAGSFAFSVGIAAPTGATAAATGTSATQGTSSVSAASVISRWLLYLGLVGLLGAVFAAEVVARRRGRWLVVLTAAAWVLATSGAILVVASQASDAGVSVGDLAGTNLGWFAVARVVPLLVAGALLVVACRRPARQGLLLRLVGVIAAFEMLVDAVASHAAATAWPWVNVGVQWLHFLAVAIWLGGLAGILLELRGTDGAERGRVVRRFRRWATLGLFVVALTGITRAAVELGSLDQLTTTDYGRLVLLKVGLFVVLAGLGAINHFRNAPIAGERPSGLRRVGSAELLVAAVVLLAAGSLVNVAPPIDTAAAASGTGAPAPASLIVDGHDYATSVKLHLVISPGTTGLNTFRATAVDYDSGAPVTATAITLRFTYPGRPDIGQSAISLTPAADGTFKGTGANLSLGGSWSVTALVESPTAPVEVPLSVTVATPPSRVDTNRAPGQPTLYTVHLSAGRTAQLYLDPWAQGAADLHITYFDATGNELPVLGVKVAVATGGGSAQSVGVDQVEPGHDIAHLRTSAGVAMSIDVTGTAPGNELLTFHIDITPDR